MPRPPKCRRVAYLPDVTAFKPVGVPMGELEEVVLSVEELEAIRLKDVEGLDQEMGSREMGVSRPTFQRILTAARAKVADALVNGKVIRIEGGVYSVAGTRWTCRHCGEVFEVPVEGHERDEADVPCPGCGRRGGWRVWEGCVKRPGQGGCRHRHGRREMSPRPTGQDPGEGRDGGGFGPE